MAFPHWSMRVEQVEGLRPALAKKSKMNLEKEERTLHSCLLCHDGYTVNNGSLL